MSWARLCNPRLLCKSGTPVWATRFFFHPGYPTPDLRRYLLRIKALRTQRSPKIRPKGSFASLLHPLRSSVFSPRCLSCAFVFACDHQNAAPARPRALALNPILFRKGFDRVPVHLQRLRMFFFFLVVVVVVAGKLSCGILYHLPGEKRQDVTEGTRNRSGSDLANLPRPGSTTAGGLCKASFIPAPTGAGRSRHRSDD